MKAVVFHGVGDIRLENVRNPQIRDQYDAIVRVTTSAICGTDLHFIRGTMTPMQSGTILGHEAVGIVDEIGKGIRNLNVGDRVIIPSTVACGCCRMCRRGCTAQCDCANPNGPDAGTTFFGGPKQSGPLDGCQAELVRVPFANNNLVKIPDDVSDDKAILLSDVFPTAYFAVDIARVKPGDVVVILGCGPIGQFAIVSCKLRGASRIFAIDNIPSRLQMARVQGAECINFDEVDPVDVVKEATKGMLADVVIEAVGLDAIRPKKGPAAKKAEKKKEEFEKEIDKIAPTKHPEGRNWIPGDAPSQALHSCVELAGKCGTISIVGVYGDMSEVFPIGKALNKNLKIVMGNCPHRIYIPRLLHKVQAGIVDPTKILTQKASILSVIDAYKQFDMRTDGWVKVALTV